MADIVAAIDVGTQSTRLLLSDGEADLARIATVTHLGKGVADTGQLDRSPSEIFRQHFIVAPFPEENVERVVAEIGIEPIVFGSDFPHGEGLAHPVESARPQLGPFSQMLGSLRRISPDEAAAIRPRIIDVVTVRPGDTVQTLASRMAYRDFQLDRFLALNGLAASTRLAAGQKVKLVVYGRRS